MQYAWAAIITSDQLYLSANRQSPSPSALTVYFSHCFYSVLSIVLLNYVLLQLGSVNVNILSSIVSSSLARPTMSLHTKWKYGYCHEPDGLFALYGGWLHQQSKLHSMHQDLAAADGESV